MKGLSSSRLYKRSSKTVLFSHAVGLRDYWFTALNALIQSGRFGATHLIWTCVMSVTKEEITTEYGTKGKNKKELHFKPR